MAKKYIGDGLTLASLDGGAPVLWVAFMVFQSLFLPRKFSVQKPAASEPLVRRVVRY